MGEDVDFVLLLGFCGSSDVSFGWWVGLACFLHFENWYPVMALRKMNFCLLNDFWLLDLSCCFGSILNCGGSHS